MRWPDAMLFQISMRQRARHRCLALCVESLLVFILLNETLEEKEEEEEEEEGKGKRSGLRMWRVTFSNLVWVPLCYLIS